MKRISLEKIQAIQKNTLFCAILCLPFSVAPKAITVSGIGQNLLYYPLILGIICFAYECWQRKKIDIPRKYLMFSYIYIIWQCICTIIGILTYEYYELIDLNQLRKLKLLLMLLSDYDIFLSEIMAIKGWLILRFIKDILKNNILIFGCVFLIYHLYHENWRQGFLDIRRAFLGLVGVLSCYSLIEIAYLRGNILAADMLSYINPFFYDVASAHGWWPRLLWPGQLRSMFAEPSFFGLVAAAVVPFLFSYILEKTDLKYILIYSFYAFLIFLTKARTATLLFIGELFLLVLCMCFQFRKKISKIVIILVCSGIAFLFSLVMFSSLTVVSGITHIEDKAISSEMNTYIEENITSIKNGQRSNTARYANTVATIKVGIDHPIFGVGTNLTSAYLESNIPDWGKDNDEIKLWSKYLHENGALESDFPILNQFSGVFAQSGFIGLFLYVLPFFYLIVCFVKQKIYKKGLYSIAIFIAFMGSFASLLGNVPFYSLYIVIGIFLCIVDSKEIKEITNV